MKELKQIKNLTQAIINSYEIRVQTVGALIRETIQLLENFQGQQKKMADELKNILAKTQSLRKKDFERMMEQMWKKEKEKEKEVHDTLEDFLREETKMIDKLRKLLNSKELIGIDDFMVLKERIFNSQRGRERKVNQVLKSFHLEQEELSTALRGLLSKGERIKIKDFKFMIRGLRAHQIHKESNIGKILQELEMVDKQASTTWQKVITS